MKTGSELIAQERSEHFTKHGRTIESDVLVNDNFELRIVASALLFDGQFLVGKDDPTKRRNKMPPYWNKDFNRTVAAKPYKERLIIAGSMIAAEIDRLQAIESVVSAINSNDFPDNIEQ